MTKKKKLVKKALKHPEQFSYGELAFFQRWLDEHKKAKSLQRQKEKEAGNPNLNTP